MNYSKTTKIINQYTIKSTKDTKKAYKHLKIKSYVDQFKYSKQYSNKQK